jgi:hypothetical protein
MRVAYLTAVFALSAFGAALLVRAITDLVPDSPPPTRSIELLVAPTDQFQQGAPPGSGPDG